MVQQPPVSVANCYIYIYNIITSELVASSPSAAAASASIQHHWNTTGYQTALILLTVEVEIEVTMYTIKT